MASEVRFAVVPGMLERAGYRLARIRGSHHCFTKHESPLVVVPVQQGKVKAFYVRQIEKLCQEHGQQEQQEKPPPGV